MVARGEAAARLPRSGLLGLRVGREGVLELLQVDEPPYDLSFRLREARGFEEGVDFLIEVVGHLCVAVPAVPSQPPDLPSQW